MKKLLFLIFILPVIATVTCSSTVPTDSIKKYTDWLISEINIADSIDYPRQFWEQNVEASLRARQEMPWGTSVPKREWLHFVLPVRVNNEALDSSRTVFYRELAPRIKNMTMEQAALETGHMKRPLTGPPTAAHRRHLPQCAPPSGAVAKNLHWAWLPCAPQAYLRAKSIHHDGHIPTTTTHGWKYGWTTNGGFSEPANRNRCST